MAAIDHKYRYSYPSRIETDANTSRLHLAAELNGDRDVRFFEGDLLRPSITARNLRAISGIVGTRFYTPPSMVARLIRESDPVVTIARDQIRFEGFSACCSTYVRHDMSPYSYSVNHLSPGTTNVDFQADMRAALAKVRSDTSLRLMVDQESVALQNDTSTVVERKVPLPTRWIKGFTEVQSHLRGMRKAITLSKVQAQQFLRALPRAKADHEQWLIKTASGVRLSTRATQNGVMIRGTQRLRALEALAVDADHLQIWFNEQHRSSAWVLDYGDQRLLLVLNAEPWRGFSGDGQVLSQLVDIDQRVLAEVRAQLAWQAAIDPLHIASVTRQNTDTVAHALSVLAAQGLVGFDLVAEAYFHRELPFDLSLIERLNPRLKSARALLESGAVAIEQTPQGHAADVHSSGVIHRVTVTQDGFTCTCPWYAKHQGERGPCKHILATQMRMDSAA
ncbi:MAG: SWIM zinc finger family protein [Pseudomonadota bacterium]